MTLASMENFVDFNDWMTSSALVLNMPLSEEQRALQEQRRKLLQTYRALLVRIEDLQYELSSYTHLRTSQ